MKGLVIAAAEAGLREVTLGRVESIVNEQVAEVATVVPDAFSALTRQ